jgi:hypothetical protein
MNITINVPVDYNIYIYGAGRNDFEGGKSISRDIGRGGPWKSRLFWALKLQRAKRMPFGPKKSRFLVKYSNSLLLYIYKYTMCYAMLLCFLCSCLPYTLHDLSAFFYRPRIEVSNKYIFRRQLVCVQSISLGHAQRDGMALGNLE